ncbi:hypothetical protein EIP91_010135 [Steccherinum ochraceum]|uniref:Uncharacterized protein n=1 Tax=Steccherinum ochraceum TaxID=92696 RepID=A0A4R0RYQ2_9APHY|nr:hypothetical protein EIP91_010135 [Steccherinum ochraceum]
MYRPHTQPTIHSSDTDETADDVSSLSYDPEYDELEQPLHGYPFELGQSVWVRPTRRWYRGHIVKVVKLDSRSRKGVLGCWSYQVRFRGNLKASFDPLMGSIKPITPRFTELIRSSGQDVSDSE